MRFIEDCKSKKELYKYLKISKEDALALDYLFNISNSSRCVEIYIDCNKNIYKKEIKSLLENKYRYKIRHITRQDEVETILILHRSQILLKWGEIIETTTFEVLTLFDIYQIIPQIFNKLKEFNKLN